MDKGEQTAIEVPPAAEASEFGQCEFCAEAGVMREPIMRSNFMPTGTYVYACNGHRENAERFARSRLTAKQRESS